MRQRSLASRPDLALKQHSWFGLFAPTGTPKPILATLRKTTEEIAKDPVFQEKLRASGGDPSYVSAADTPALIDRELKKWIPMMKNAGIEPLSNEIKPLRIGPALRVVDGTRNRYSV